MKITGNTVGTSNPRPDWQQEDSQKANFILNKPAEMELPAYTEDDYGKVLSATASGLKWVKPTGGGGAGSIYAAYASESVLRAAIVDDTASTYEGKDRTVTTIQYATILGEGETT